MKAQTLPATTRAAVYEGDGSVVVRTLSIAPPADGELLVRIRACGLCGSEALRWYADSKAPFVLGHEPVAEIAAAGKDAKPAGGDERFQPGERVFVHHHAPCMHCRYCSRGDYVQCETWRESRLIPGALSEYAIVPAPNVRHDVLRVPPGLSDEAATLVEPLATVMKSVRRSGLRQGDRVLVLGLGAMGMLHLLAARARGAQLLIAADQVGFRLERAKSFGAHESIDVSQGSLAEQVRKMTGEIGADVVFVTPGAMPALESAAESVARGGTIVIFTPLAPGEGWTIDVNDLFFRDVKIVTSYSAGPDDTKEALALLASGLGVESLFTHRFSLEEAPLAYAALKKPEEALKVIVYP